MNFSIASPSHFFFFNDYITVFSQGKYGYFYFYLPFSKKTIEKADKILLGKRRKQWIERIFCPRQNEATSIVFDARQAVILAESRKIQLKSASADFSFKKKQRERVETLPLCIYVFF